MRKQVRKIISGFFFMVLFGMGFSQSPGIRTVQTNEKSTTYEIRVIDLSGPFAANFLDSKMLDKQGILSAKTDDITRICRTEVLEWVGENELRLIIEGLGFSIAKLFE